MNADQRQFTAYVLALEDTHVWKARMRVQDAEYKLRLAQHELDMAKFALEMAEESQQHMQETLG